MERQTCFYPKRYSWGSCLSIYLFWCTRNDFIGLSHFCLLAMIGARSCLERPLSRLSSWSIHVVAWHPLERLPCFRSQNRAVYKVKKYSGTFTCNPLLCDHLSKRPKFSQSKPSRQVSLRIKLLSQEENLLIPDQQIGLFLDPWFKPPCPPVFCLVIWVMQAYISQTF